MFKEGVRLTPDQISEYNEKGYELDDKKMYIIKFLFNDKWNNAASWKDPTVEEPFRVKTELVEKLANDAIGMPYVVNPKASNRHLSGSDEGLPDTPEALLEIQALYSYGVIKVPIIKPNNNVYGIIEIFEDYEQEVENGNLPPFTSPSLVPLKTDDDGISDAQFININGVDVSGYTEVLAGTHGVCKNGIKECVTELSLLGASGILKSSRDNDKKFLSNLKSLQKNMSTEGTTPPAPAPEQTKEPTLTDIAAKIDAVETKVDEVVVLEEKVVANVETNAEVLKEVATVTEGVDENKVQEKVGESTPPVDDANPDEPIIVGASGKTGALTIPKELKDNSFVNGLVQQVKNAQKDLNQIKKDAMSKKEQEDLAVREAQATSIVERQILLSQVKPEDKNKEIKKYVELQNEDKTLVDLSALDAYLKSSVSAEPSNEPGEMVGASGFQPLGMRSDATPGKMSNAEAMGIDA